MFLCDTLFSSGAAKQTALPADQPEQAGPDTENRSYTFKMQIEDVFTIPGMGTLACGPIETGEIRKNDTVRLISGEKTSLSFKITDIRTFESDKGLDSAKAGQTVGLVCQGISKEQLSKNDVLAVW